MQCALQKDTHCIYQDGIWRLCGSCDAPTATKKLLAQVRNLNPVGLHYCPGLPYLENLLLQKNLGAVLNFIRRITETDQSFVGNKNQRTINVMIDLSR